MAPSITRKREEQGRLFWVWLLSLPILLLLGASRVFGTPWPNPLTQRIAQVMLAFPVLFGVGEPLFSGAIEALRRHRPDVSAIVAGAAMAGYVCGVLAVFLPLPATAGASALLVALYLTLRYFAGRY